MAAKQSTDSAQGAIYGSRGKAALALGLIIADLGNALAHSADSADSTEEIERMVVTTQTRQENLKDVPASVAVVGGAALKDQRINNIEQLQSSVPRLSVIAVENRKILSPAGSAPTWKASPRKTVTQCIGMEPIYPVLAGHCLTFRSDNMSAAKSYNCPHISS